MTTLFLLVTGVCQSLNELGVASVTKKWSGQNRTSRTACYGPNLEDAVRHGNTRVSIHTVDTDVVVLSVASASASTYPNCGFPLVQGRVSDS